MSRVLLALILISCVGERRDIHDRDLAVASFLREQAPRRAIDCGVGRDLESDAGVYDCGSRAVASHQSFFVQYVPHPPERITIGDVVPLPPPPFVLAGYLYDGESSSLRSVTAGSDGITTYAVSIGPQTAATHFARGMRPPALDRSVTGPSPSTEINGVVLIECTIDSSGRLTHPKVIKPLPRGVDTAAVALLSGVRFEPARLFGLAVPVLWTVTVHSENGTLYVEAKR